MLAKAASATGCMLASEPPPMATSQRPGRDEPGRGGDGVGAGGAGGADDLGRARASPSRMEMPAAPALAIIIGTSRGETRSAPFSL